MNALTAISLSAVAFSFFPLFNSLGLAVTSPILFAFFNQVATIFIAFTCLLLMVKSPSKIADMLKSFWALPTETKLILFFSGFSVYLGGVFFLFALSIMSKAGATVIMEMRPLIAIFIAPLLMAEKKWQSFTIQDFFLIIIAILGLWMITASEGQMTFGEFLQNPFHMFANQPPQAYIGIVIAFMSAFCFAFSGISRAHFANKLPKDFRTKHFGKTETITESLYAYFIAYVLGFPVSILLLLFLEADAYASVASVAPAMLNGAALVATSVFYSYAILKTRNSNLNLILYFSPLLAAVWLSMAGLSEITEMLVIGGALIIIANIFLVLSDRRKRT